MDKTELLDVVAPLIDGVARHGLGSLQPRERVVYLVWCFAGQVDNGGFAQFFFNSTGEYAGETVEALLEVGCSGSASLLQTAMSRFREGVPSDLAVRNAALNAMPSAVEADWTNLDNAYFEGDANNIFARLDRYWKQGAA